MSGYYLGIDGGGTKTRATILDANGFVLSTGTSASSNFGNIGKRLAGRNIEKAIHSAADKAGTQAHSFDAVFLGIAGVVSQQDRDTVLELARQMDLADDGMISVDHDCRIALAGGRGGQHGIVQIVGTGASCFGINAAGERWMAGGWGHLLADEGGGYWMGIQAMKAATAACDTRGKPTILTETVLEALGIDTIEQIMHTVYSEDLTVSDIAALSRTVIDAAQQDDPLAIDIIARGMEEVARCVKAVSDHLAFPDDEMKLVFTGGILQAGPVITGPFESAVHRHLPTCKIEAPRFPAVVGAGLLARQLHHGVIEPAFLNNLKTSLQEME